jgi:formate hydrogenlyase subunit 3/multisubunit Na+/H+ antiporter MnhD subunit
MNQVEFLLFFLAALPFLSCLFLRIFADNSALFSLTSKASPIAFLLVLLGIFNATKTAFSFSIIDVAPGISFGFAVDQNSLGFLFLLNFLWLIFAFHAQRFFKIYSAKNGDELQFFFVLILAFLNLVLISKNLLSALFFYNCLVIFCHFFAAKFLHKEENDFLRFFTFLLYLESFFFFLAIVATRKFGGEIEFGSLTFSKLDDAEHAFLLILYLLGLFFALLLPSYVFYRKNSLELLVTYIFLFFGYAFGGLYIFSKLLGFAFGFDEFSLAVSKIGFGFFEWVFLLNITLASALLLLSKNFRTSFFYLFFQQLLTGLFAVFLFAHFDSDKIYLPILSFLLSFSLVFFCFSNLILYFTKSANKSIDGCFYKLTITSSLLLFALLNMAGTVPGVGAVEKFFLLKIIAKKKLMVSGIAVVVSSLTIFIFTLKNFYRIFLAEVLPKKEASASKKSKEVGKETTQEIDKEIAKEIDFDSSLTLGAFALAVAIFSAAIFYPILTKFFNPL